MRPARAAVLLAGTGLALCGLRGLAAPAAPQPAAATTEAARRAPAPSPRNASYSIDVELDARSHTLTGREVITWRNITDRPTSELRFHTYWNAWRNTRSTWMRERIRAVRAAGGDLSDLVDRPAGEWSSIDVSAVRLLAGGASPMTDLTPDIRYVAPDDGNEDDRTVMAVPLPRAAGPGDTLTIEVAWTSHVPRTFARTGVIGNFFFIAQWFPKLGVLEDGGWNTHQFHAGTEFFSDYGVYDVRMTVPRGWVLGATGREQSKTDTPSGKTVHRYVEQDVHDFAWTTSPDFLVRTEKFEHPRLPAVEMRLLLQPEHAGLAERHFAATRATLASYGDWYGPYPYGHITIVDPAWQSRAGGMEYPTLFTAGSRWLSPASVGSPEGVTVHECGHQFWYGLSGNNEFEDAWLDEGLNTFSTARVMDETFSPGYLATRFFGGFVPWVFHDLPVSRAVSGDRIAGYRAAAKSDAQATPSWKYFPATGGAITYNKTALWLHTLERMIGWRRLSRGLSTFFQRATFHHPTPEMLFSALNGAAGTDLTWYFNEVYRSSNVFDYAVGSLASSDAGVRGLVDGQNGATYAAGRPTGTFHTEVMVQRLGEAVFPVDVLVTFADGTTAREHWDGRDRWKLYTYDRPARAVSAEVDPDHVLLLDVNFTNNSRTLSPLTDKAARHMAARWLVWAQDLVMTYAFVS
jgi:hypothetical protein